MSEYKKGELYNDTNRKGDIAENKAVNWLWEQGYEVFKNASATGLIDIVVVEPTTGDYLFIDVKIGTPGSGLPTRSPEQQFLKVRQLRYRKHLDDFYFVAHKDLDRIE